MKKSARRKTLNLGVGVATKYTDKGINKEPQEKKMMPFGPAPRDKLTDEMVSTLDMMTKQFTEKYGLTIPQLVEVPVVQPVVQPAVPDVHQEAGGMEDPDFDPSIKIEDAESESESESESETDAELTAASNAASLIAEKSGTDSGDIAALAQKEIRECAEALTKPQKLNLTPEAKRKLDVQVASCIAIKNKLKTSKSPKTILQEFRPLPFIRELPRYRTALAIDGKDRIIKSSVSYLGTTAEAVLYNVSYTACEEVAAHLLYERLITKIKKGEFEVNVKVSLKSDNPPKFAYAVDYRAVKQTTAKSTSAKSTSAKPRVAKQANSAKQAVAKPQQEEAKEDVPAAVNETKEKTVQLIMQIGLLEEELDQLMKQDVRPYVIEDAMEKIENLTTELLIIQETEEERDAISKILWLDRLRTRNRKDAERTHDYLYDRTPTPDLDDY